MGGYIKPRNKEILIHRMYEGDSVYKEDSTQIRPNFKLCEFVCSCCNTTILNHKQLDLVQSIRDYMNRGIKINSHFRCGAYNKKVGGYKYSRHMNGTASDLNINPNELNQEQLQGLVNHAVEHGAKEIGLYYSKRFIHFATESTSTKFNKEHKGIKYRLFIKR